MATREYTAEQLERRKASRDRWRAAHPNEWRERRYRPSVPGGAPAGANAGAPDTSVALRARVAELEARETLRDAHMAELTAMLEAANARIENDRQRSRRNVSRRRRHAPRQLPLSVPAHQNAVPARAGTPLNHINAPRVNNREVIYAAAAAGGAGGAAAAAGTNPDDVWIDAEVLAAARSRGLDAALERSKLESYLAEHPAEAYSRRRVLRWLETAWPAASIEAAAPSPVPRSFGGRVERGDRDAELRAQFAWADEHMVGVEAAQDLMIARRAAAGVV